MNGKKRPRGDSDLGRRRRDVIAGEDDFLEEARQDRDAYVEEVEAEQRAREEARKANRRYVKAGTRKAKAQPEVDKGLFERLRKRLHLRTDQAASIQLASKKSLRQKHDATNTAIDIFDGADQASSEEPSDSEEPSLAAVRQDDETPEDGHCVRVTRRDNAKLSPTEPCQSDSEEEAIVLSLPGQSRSLRACRKSHSGKEGERPLQKLRDQDALSSSDEDVIDLTQIPRTKGRATTAIPASALLSVPTLCLPKDSGNNRLMDESTLKTEASGNRPSPPPRHSSPSASSDEELIQITSAPRQSGHLAAREDRPSSLAQIKSDPSTELPRAESMEAVGNGSTSDTADRPSQMAYEGSCRPAFTLSAHHMTTGALSLDENVEVPAPINRFLRDYQREGVKFFYDNYKKKQGGLLGDDMGLGKTIQVIAFLSAIMRKKGLESTDENRRIRSVRAGRLSAQGQRSNAVWPTCLIVCPNSVQTNWQNELDTWGYFEHDLLTDDSLRDFQRGRLDILITSHQKAKLWIDKLNVQHWSVVFVDECHMLKNPGSGLTRAMNTLNCSSRFGLTGTAIQNRFDEFWTLLDWCIPGEFGSLKHWQQMVAIPIRKGQSASATTVELAHARLVAEALRDKLLPTCFLRRTKDLIKAQLPNKRDNIVFCPLTPLQIASYKSILEEPEVLMIRLAKDPCDCGQLDEDGLPYMRCRCCYAEDEEGRPWNYHMLKYIMLLQRCSNHLALVFPDPHDNIAVSSVSPLADQMRKHRFLRQTAIVQQLFPDSWQTKTNNKTNGFRAEFCGKWLVLRRLMQEWKLQGDKVLLFSMNLRLLDWLSYFVEMEGYRHVQLDGSTAQKKRQPLVNEFNHDPQLFVFLISTTAGGTGLNLTGANKVVVFDPHWNPAHDLQAMDRAYRFGQTRDVDVYRLIGKGSLEETIYDRQLYKQQLGRIGYDASEERRYFQPGDAQGFPKLFELHDASSSVTRDMIQACDLTEATFALQHIVKDAEVDKIKSEEVKADWNSLLAPALEEGSVAGGPSQANREEDDDPIARVLQMSGIEYTHINDSLLGGSAVESAMSKRAKRAVTASARSRSASAKSDSSAAPRRPAAARPQSSFPATPSWPPLRSTPAPNPT